MPAVVQSAISLASTSPTTPPVITADELILFTPPTPQIIQPTRSAARKRKAVATPPLPGVRLAAVQTRAVPTVPPRASAGWALPADAPVTNTDGWFLDSSLVEQMDALVFAIFRRRLEHDAVAQVALQSYTPSFGRLVSPLSTVCSVYSGPCGSWPLLIERVIAERGLGLFICKVAPDSGPKCFADGSMTWYQLLSSKALLRFDFTGECCRLASPTTGRPFAPLLPVCALLVSFGPAGFLPRRCFKRKEKKFTLAPCTIALSDGKIGTLPLCLARPSPLAPERGTAPHGAPSDGAPPSTRDPPYRGFPEPKPTWSWNEAALDALARFYPIKAIADIAREAASEAGFASGFTGDRSKRVSADNMVSDESKIELIRGRLREEVAAGRVAGPFKRSPFPNEWCSGQAREAPLGLEPKFKYVPDSDEFRMVSHFSHCKPSSVNDLSWNPRIIDCPFQAGYLMVSVVNAGRNAQVFAGDQKKAYRKQLNRKEDLHLFVYRLSPTEFYAELCHPFGHVTSEICFHAITSVIQWALPHKGIATSDSPAHNFVDNWYLVAKASDATFAQRAEHLESLLTGLGAEVHEQQMGPRFNALGWDWDTEALSITCPQDKLAFYRNQLAKWSKASLESNRMSTKRCEKLTGILNFLATVTPSFRIVVGHLKSARRKALNRKESSFVLPPEALAAVLAVAKFMLTWSGSSPMFKPFSPRDPWDFLLRLDASSEYGFGGFVLPLERGHARAWSDEERALSLAPQLKSESSTALELMALRNLLSRYAPAMRGSRIQIEMDSATSILGLRAWSSGTLIILGLLNEIHQLLIEHSLIARFEHIGREFNQIADYLSKDQTPQAVELFAEEFRAVMIMDSSR